MAMSAFNWSGQTLSSKFGKGSNQHFVFKVVLADLFFKLLFGCPTTNFGPLLRRKPHSPNVNHCVLHIRPEGHREPRYEVGSLNPAKCLTWFDPGTFRFWLQCLTPLSHSPQSYSALFGSSNSYLHYKTSICIMAFTRWTELQ